MGCAVRAIQTAYGKRHVVRRIGSYVETIPTPAAPNGEWWVLNPQKGYVPVASNSRALLHTLAHGAYGSLS
jgi:hypothetical protein